jgi:hypothetical protein
MGREHAFTGQSFSKPYSMREVNGKHVNGDVTCRCEAHEQSAVPLEMIFPPVSSRVEQSNDVTAIAIYSDNVRPFVVVAGEAGEREVIGLVRSVMLTRDDVIDLKCEQVERLRHTEVLAGPFGASPNPIYE